MVHALPRCRVRREDQARSSAQRLDDRKAGTWEATTTEATRNSDITCEAVFKEYVESPTQKVPGTRMAFADLSEPRDRMISGLI